VFPFIAVADCVYTGSRGSARGRSDMSPKAAPTHLFSRVAGHFPRLEIFKGLLLVILPCSK
jgi:hypothetical protein